MTAMDRPVPDSFEDEDDGDMDIATLGEFAYALNPDHFIRFRRRGPAILVSFEQEDDAGNALSTRASRFDDLAGDMNWSVLTLVSRGLTWFRAPEVITFFDALVDGTLLDQFDTALFYGQGAGGHAALSYALTSPQARILALAPHYGFGMADAPDDNRFDPSDDIDFTSRYAPVPEHLNVADAAWLLHDPVVAPDRAHVDRLAAETTVPLRCRHMGSQLETPLADLGMLEEIVVRAMEGALSEPAFYTALRARRDDPASLRRLIGRLIAADRPVLEALAVRNIAQRTGRHRFARRFEQIEADLKARGLTIPPARKG